MPVTALISIPVSDSPDTTIQALKEALQASSVHFVIGVDVQDPKTVHITSEWPETNSAQRWVESIRNLSASTPTITFAHLAQSSITQGTPPCVEYVKTDFPATSATPSFQAGIEKDFTRFEEIVRRRGRMEDVGEVFVTTGWTEEHESEGKQVKSFVVVRGWEAIEKFQEAVQTEELKEAIPILIGWGAPWKMWHVERKVVSEGL